MARQFRVFVPAALIAAIGMLGWWGLASPSKAPAEERPHVGPVEVPLHWEYKMLAYHPILENMEKELNKLGIDGWEVAGVSNGAVQQVILKRAHR
ncbi:MAG TPA: hypothetical protein VG097_08510 [Gemmata sp.]|jgi:hypothetical protein|nr:hypothetical protein [Gemmata sp.]